MINETNGHQAFPEKERKGPRATQAAVSGEEGSNWTGKRWPYYSVEEVIPLTGLISQEDSQSYSLNLPHAVRSSLLE